MEQAKTDEMERHVNAVLESLKPEFPERGLLLGIMDALGGFTHSTNMNPQVAAGLLRHIADHLDGRCKCG